MRCGAMTGFANQPSLSGKGCERPWLSKDGLNVPALFLLEAPLRGTRARLFARRPLRERATGGKDERSSDASGKEVDLLESPTLCRVLALALPMTWEVSSRNIRSVAFLYPGHDRPCFSHWVHPPSLASHWPMIVSNCTLCGHRMVRDVWVYIMRAYRVILPLNWIYEKQLGASRGFQNT